MGFISRVVTYFQEGQTHNNLGHPFSVLVTNALTDHVAFSVCGTSLAFNVTGLTPSTEYDVKIVDTITRCTLLDMRLRTFGPGAKHSDLIQLNRINFGNRNPRGAIHP